MAKGLEDGFFRWLEKNLPRFQKEADRRGRDVEELMIETFEIALETIEKESWPES